MSCAKRFLLSLGAGVAFGTALPAAAALVTFEDVAAGGNDIQTSVNSGGFNFSSEHFHIINQPGNCAFGGCVSNGTQYMAEDAPTLARPVTMTLIGSGTFSLASFDGAELFLDSAAAAAGGFQNALAIRVLGNISGGGTITQDFILDQIKDGAGGVNDFQQFLFGAGWTNLTSAVWSGTDGQGLASMSVDNINTGQVPEPSSLLLLATGLLGFVSWSRLRVA